MKIRFTSAVLIFAIFWLTNCSPASRNANQTANRPDRLHNLPKSPQFVGIVTRVVDGDTIDVLDEINNPYRIRLKGIDTPEKQQSFGYEARQNLAAWVAGKSVTVEWLKIDLNHRIVGKVSVNGDDVCLEQIKAGFAWHYKEFENEQTERDRQLYAEAELQARALKRGLWEEVEPIPPWKFRHGREGNEVDTNLVVSNSNTNSTTTNSGEIRGNRRTMIYQWPGCPYYYQISPPNRVSFNSREQAEQAGYRAARNCRIR